MARELSVIIPTLNEASTIGRVLSEMPKELIDEVIVVDSSDDATPKIVQSLGVKVIYENRMGYGRALQTGIENAGGEIIVCIDGDSSYDPREIPRLVQLLFESRCDIVLGSRFKGRMLPGSMSRLNKLGNLMLTLVFNILFLRRISDTQTGFRAFRKSLFKSFSSLDYGMPYVTVQLIKLIKLGANIREVPITYHPRIGKTKLSPLRDGFQILKVMLRGRFYS